MDSFYLNGKIITARYLTSKLINNDFIESAQPSLNMQTTEELANRIGYPLDMISTKQLVADFISKFSTKNSKGSVYDQLILCDKTHILALAILNHKGLLEDQHITDFISSTNYRTRTQILINLINQEKPKDNEKIDLFGKLMSLCNQKNMIVDSSLPFVPFKKSDVSSLMATFCTLETNTIPVVDYDLPLNTLYGKYIYKNPNAAFSYLDTSNKVVALDATLESEIQNKAIYYIWPDQHKEYFTKFDDGFVGKCLQSKEQTTLTGEDIVKQDFHEEFRIDQSHMAKEVRRWIHNEPGKYKLAKKVYKALPDPKSEYKDAKQRTY